MSAATVTPAMVKQVKKWKSSKVGTKTAPAELKIKVIEILDGGANAKNLASQLGVRTNLLYNWRWQLKKESKSAKQLKRVKTKHKTRRSKRAVSAYVSKPARKQTASRIGVDFAELQNARGDVLRIPFNQETLPFIIEHHYGAK
jgi:transposase-like protein